MAANHVFRGLAIVVGAATVALLGLVATVLARTGEFEAFALVAPLGGVGIAILLTLARSLRHAPIAVPDPFARDLFSRDTLNISHIRVAGVGGLALVLVSALVAFAYELTRTVLAAGLLGGVVCGGLLILSRRRRS